MAKGSSRTPPPVFQSPILLEWTDEKLQQLDQQQLLNLIDNLARQRTIGRLKDAEADALKQRIAPLVTGRKGSDLRMAKDAKDALAAQAGSDAAA
jgi:predicted RNase H-like nuclease